MIQHQLKLKLRPAQERQLVRWFWHLTGVWNWAIRKIELDAKEKVYHSAFDFTYLIKGHSQRLGIPYNVINATTDAAVLAWRGCFDGRCGKPRLKGRRNRLQSCLFKKLRTVPSDRRLVLTGLGSVKFHKQEIPAGRIKQARIIRRASGWYMCLSIEAEPIPIPHIADGEIGIDPGFSSLLTLSTGEQIEHPRELEASALRLGQAQRGGRKRLAARIQERIANQRKDRNHKLSRRLVAENRLIAFSADHHRSIARRFGKSVTSSGHYQLRQMLAVKCRAGGRTYIEVPSRNSTRTCSACGRLSGPTGYAGLSVRVWTCDCGVTHGRDCNAAVNTLALGRGLRLDRTRESSSGIATIARRRQPTVDPQEASK